MKKPNRPKDLWFCENFLCERPLARIIKGDITEPQIVEILGKNGQQFFVRPHYVKLYCHDCGEQNDLIGGKPLSDEWKKNFQEELDDGLITGEEEDNFYTNQYLRNLLLERLTPSQKLVFEFMRQHPDGEWNAHDIATALQITDEVASEGYRAIVITRGDIRAEESLKKARQVTEWAKKPPRKD